MGGNVSWRWVLRPQKPKAGSISFLLLPADPNVEHSATLPHPVCSHTTMLSTRSINISGLETTIATQAAAAALVLLGCSEIPHPRKASPVNNFLSLSPLWLHHSLATEEKALSHTDSLVRQLLSSRMWRAASSQDLNGVL